MSEDESSPRNSPKADEQMEATEDEKPQDDLTTEDQSRSSEPNADETAPAPAETTPNDTAEPADIEPAAAVDTHENNSKEKAVDSDSDTDEEDKDTQSNRKGGDRHEKDSSRRDEDRSRSRRRDSDSDRSSERNYEPARERSFDQKILASRDNEDERKIFVGGLSWETTVDDVKEYFNHYGHVLDCTLKTDPATGKSRGFAFVLFEESSAVDKVFNESIHMLNGRKIDPKKALARGGRDPVKKVFVGGLPPDFPLEDIKEYFGKFGRIVEVEQPFDRQKNQRRAFIFITYESEEIVEAVVANPKQTVGGREVDVRKATPKSETDGGGRGGRGGFNNQRGGASGGYGDGWGGQVPPAYTAPPGYDYYSSYYGAYPGYPGYPAGYPGYDYSQYYDYSAYYAQQQQQQQQQPPADWSSYPGYTAAPGYTAPPYTGYDYSSWYGTDPSGGQAPAAGAATTAPGKAKRGSSSAPYHPYSR